MLFIGMCDVRTQMSLRAILAQEGLLKSASVVITPRTKARMNGGSLAVKRALMDILLQLPGEDILKFTSPRNGRPYKLKPGWAKWTSDITAKQLSEALGTLGFEVLDGSLLSNGGLFLRKETTSITGGRGLTVYVSIIKTERGPFVVSIPDTDAVGTLVELIR